MTLSQDTIRIVKSTAPVLAAHGEAITTHFYQDMFRHNPELLDIFNSSNQYTGDQPRALAAAVYGYAANIDNLGALAGVVERIAHKHASFNIKPEHYPIVGKHLLGAVAHVLGAAATDEILQAWTEAYGFLADRFINVEEGIYKHNEETEGGWRGTREFRVARKQKESDVITSFYFEPVDGQAIVDFKPGQYIGIYLESTELKHHEIRQYSLSGAFNGKNYRISVKREVSKNHEGLISNYLHDRVMEGDIVKLSPPAGDFFLDTSINSPVVLISGGVGQTPLLSMFNSMIESDSDREIHYIHSALSSKQHAFGTHVKQTADEHKNVHSILFYDHVEPDDKHHDHEARANLDLIRDQIDIPDAHYYFCGPAGFMSMVNNALKGWGVQEDRLHYEVFGPHKEI